MKSKLSQDHPEITRAPMRSDLGSREIILLLPLALINGWCCIDMLLPSAEQGRSRVPLKLSSWVSVNNLAERTVYCSHGRMMQRRTRTSLMMQQKPWSRSVLYLEELIEARILNSLHEAKALPSLRNRNLGVPSFI
ncbi:hypothetical protein ACFX13_012389 [Malus domestica]